VIVCPIQPKSLVLRVAYIRALMGEKRRDLPQRLVISDRRARDVFRKPGLMELLAPRENGLCGRDADAAAEI
jgi:hypothetical protein